MRRIILHIGPEKCGSTSIQAALGADGPLAGVLTGVVLDPYAVHALGSDPPAPALLDSFRVVIRQAQAAGRPVVLSHEMIFKSLPILTALTRLALEEADEVIAVAYVRPQSDFLVSAFVISRSPTPRSMVFFHFCRLVYDWFCLHDCGLGFVSMVKV